MADADTDRAPEGWHVPQRVAFVAAALVPLALLLGVVATGRGYVCHERPVLHHRTATFPAPGVETFIHDGHGDPVRPPQPVAIDPAVAAAKQAVVHEGIAGWSTRP